MCATWPCFLHTFNFLKITENREWSVGHHQSYTECSLWCKDHEGLETFDASSCNLRLEFWKLCISELLLGSWWKEPMFWLQNGTKPSGTIEHMTQELLQIVHLANALLCCHVLKCIHDRFLEGNFLRSHVLSYVWWDFERQFWAELPQNICLQNINDLRSQIGWKD